MREATVYIVDDDPGLSASLAALFRSVSLRAEVFQHPQSFLDLGKINRPACIILDVRLPGVNGLDVLERIRQFGWTVPIIMISGHADVVMAVRAMHRGASDFLEKPVNDTILLQLVQHHISCDAYAFSCELLCERIRCKLETLTERERAVLQCILQGQPNKVAARQLGLSVKAVEGHRINLLHKMGCASVVDLVNAVGSCPKANRNPQSCSRGGGCHAVPHVGFDN
ncbi:MAG: response regulator transcription factor [Rhodospirillaceae bacterium]|nr:response regulator transcription factor [Rhodospirillaceae bacterium]